MDYKINFLFDTFNVCYFIFTYGHGFNLVCIYTYSSLRAPGFFIPVMLLKDFNTSVLPGSTMTFLCMTS